VTPNGSVAKGIDETDACPEAWSDDLLEGGVEMPKHVYMVIFFLLMIASIVGADVLFLSNHFLARLVVNIAIVVVFTAIYFVFLRNL